MENSELSLARTVEGITLSEEKKQVMNLGLMRALVDANAKMVVQESKQSTTKVALPAKDVVAQMKSLLRSIPLEAQDVTELLTILRNRTVNKTYFVCRKVKPEIDGVFLHPNNNVNMRKQFYCEDCKVLNG